MTLRPMKELLSEAMKKREEIITDIVDLLLAQEDKIQEAMATSDHVRLDADYSFDTDEANEFMSDLVFERAKPLFEAAGYSVEKGDDYFSITLYWDTPSVE